MSANRLKNCIAGLAIFTLIMTSSPWTVFSLPVTANLPRLGLGSALATFTQLDLYPNIETIGVVASGASLPNTAELLFRESSDTTWRTGHPLMRIDDGRLVGSLFGLAPATSYDIRVLDGATQISGSITTQPDLLPSRPQQSCMLVPVPQPAVMDQPPRRSKQSKKA